jgi:hypothetical protein
MRVESDTMHAINEPASPLLYTSLGVIGLAELG